MRRDRHKDDDVLLGAGPSDGDPPASTSIDPPGTDTVTSTDGNAVGTGTDAAEVAGADVGIGTDAAGVGGTVGVAAVGVGAVGVGAVGVGAVGVGAVGVGAVGVGGTVGVGVGGAAGAVEVAGVVDGGVEVVEDDGAAADEPDADAAPTGGATAAPGTAGAVDGAPADAGLPPPGVPTERRAADGPCAAPLTRGAEPLVGGAERELGADPAGAGARCVVLAPALGRSTHGIRAPGRTGPPSRPTASTTT